MKKYHKEYEIDTSKNEEKNIKYRYIGNYYLITLNQSDKYKIFINNLFFCLLYFILFLIAGLQNNHGSRNFFIAVPYVFLCFPIAYLTFGTFSIRNISEKMERVAYDKSFGRVRRSCISIMFLTVYLCLADFVFILINGKQINFIQEIVFLCVIIAVFACTLIHKNYLHKLQKKVIICRHDDGVPVDK